MTDRTQTTNPGRVIIAPNCGIKKILVRTGTTLTGATDTATVTLANYGCDRVLAVYGNKHTTDYSVLEYDSCTTSVSAGVLTILTETGDDSKRRAYTVWAESGA